MPTFAEWQAEQVRRRNEAPQPFVNQMTTYTYIPRTDGDAAIAGAIPAPVAGNPGVAVGYTPVVGYPSYYYANAYPGGYYYAAPAAAATTAGYAYYPMQTIYPGYPGYGYGLYGPNVTAPPGWRVAPMTLPDGTTPWFGRTPNEVVYDTALQAAASTANCEIDIAPKDAKPGDPFWLHDPGLRGANKWILSNYATIKEMKGSWKWDDTAGVRRLVFWKDAD